MARRYFTKQEWRVIVADLERRRRWREQARAQREELSAANAELAARQRRRRS